MRIFRRSDNQIVNMGQEGEHVTSGSFLWKELRGAVRIGLCEAKSSPDRAIPPPSSPMGPSNLRIFYTTFLHNLRRSRAPFAFGDTQASY